MHKPTLRKTAPAPEVLEARRTWGGRLLVELNGLRKTSAWLGKRVGYKLPGSMRQVINGHQGVSIEVYKKILRAVPAMKKVDPPPMRKSRQGKGAPGPHKPHDYPKLGPVNGEG